MKNKMDNFIRWLNKNNYKGRYPLTPSDGLKYGRSLYVKIIVSVPEFFVDTCSEGENTQIFEFQESGQVHN